MTDNAELVRRSFAAIRAWDVEALLGVYHPDIRFMPMTGTRVETGGYQGHDGVRAYLAEAEELWEVLAPEAELITDLGEFVIVAGHCLVRGRVSGAESDPVCGWVIGVRDGLIVSHQACSSYDEALEAAGLEPAEDPTA